MSVHLAPLNVLQVNKFHYNAGGAETYCFALSELLEQQGHHVGHFSMTHEMNFDSPYAKHFVDTIDYADASLGSKIQNAAKIVYSREARRKIAGLLDSESFNLAHLHNFHHQISMSILPELKRRKIPVVYTTHDLKPACPNYRMLTHDGICERCKGKKFYNALIHRCTKNSRLKSLISVVEMYFEYMMGYYDLVDVYVTPSNFYREKFIEFGLDGDRIVHVPNFVHVNQFEPNYEPGNYLLYIGRLSSEKGIPTLLKAMESLEDVPLKIVGTGDYEDTIRESIESGTLENVSLLGYRTGDALKELIQGCLAVVLPSEWYENGPMSVIEAYAYGKPVIGADIGGIPEMVLEGETGFLFKSGDAADLVEAVKRLKKSNVEEIGKNARARAEAEYDVSKHYDRIAAVYDRALSS